MSWLAEDRHIYTIYTCNFFWKTVFIHIPSKGKFAKVFLMYLFSVYFFSPPTKPSIRVCWPCWWSPVCCVVEVDVEVVQPGDRRGRESIALVVGVITAQIVMGLTRCLQRKGCLLLAQWAKTLWCSIYWPLSSAREHICDMHVQAAWNERREEEDEKEGMGRENKELFVHGFHKPMGILRPPCCPTFKVK